MESFLDKVAKAVLEKFPGESDSLCIILPNRRAGVFMRKSLATAAGKTIWSPGILSIEDFIQHLSPLRITDKTESIFLLYSSYRKLKGSSAEPFEDFYSWGTVLLNDFEEIDHNLADGKLLFSNLKNVKELESWSLGEPDLTEFQSRFLDFWKSLGELYSAFHDDLDGKHLAYEALAYRKLAENDSWLSEGLPWKNFVFAGFNALNKAEHTIMQKLFKAGKAYFYWDIDAYYYRNEVQEAGKFLRRFVPDFTKPREEVSWINEELLSEKKHIHITAAPNSVAQAKAAGLLLDGFVKDGIPGEKIALVLADESLLFPVLNSIPPAIRNINVTMGYPLKDTPIYGFIDSFFRLHESKLRFGRKDKEGNFYLYHKDLVNVLSNPILHAALEDKDLPKKIVQDILRHNRVFISPSIFSEVNASPADQPFYAQLSSATNAATCISSLISFLELSFERLESFDEGLMEKEYLFEAVNLLNKAQKYQQDHEVFPDLKGLGKFIRQLFRQHKIPFFGEPLNGIQIMGVLETRAIDFDKVIVLSVNEDKLPAGRSGNSFIPFDVKIAFDMPTYRERDAIFSYHFYRLLQKAGTIHLLHTTVKDVFGSGEKSRFLLQLQHELTGTNKHIDLQTSILELPLSSAGNKLAKGEKGNMPGAEVKKTPAVTARLNELCASGFSPSALNLYRNCRMQFFYTHVARIYEPDQVEDIIGADVMGTAIHSALEELYAPSIAIPLSEEKLRQIKKELPGILEKSFLEHYSKTDLSQGQNFLAFQAATKFLKKFVDLEITRVSALPGNAIIIQALELEMRSIIETGFGPAVIKGTADRLEKQGNIIRVIDYKTGKAGTRELNPDSIEEVLEDELYNKSFQLLVYSWLYSRQEQSSMKLEAHILSFRELSEGLKTLKINGEAHLSVQVLEEFGEGLKKLLEEILDPGLAFDLTEDTQVCKYCNFKTLCNR